MSSTITVFIDHTLHQVLPNISVAAAIAIAHDGKMATRISVTGKNRAPLCGMGVCQECRVTIIQKTHQQEIKNAHQLACQTLCTEGMRILTGKLA